MRTLFPLVAIVAALAILAGCAPSSAVEDQTSEDQPKEVSLNLPPVEGLPDYAYRSAMSLRGYQIAVLERDLLAKLPCFCGCGQDEQYKSLRDCFLDDKGGFRSHGANCEVCLEEAQDAAFWKSQGMTTGEIRQKIDQAYEGRGKPTDTPPVDG